MRALFIIVLVLASGLCSAKPFSDQPLEFSVDIPDATKVDIAENERGRSVTLDYQRPDTDDTFAIQAVRANNGGFNTPVAAMFARMMDGASDTLGKRPSLPLRTLPYRGHELHVAQHEGVGEGGSQTLTTVVFFQERGAWRKVITLQLVTRDKRAPSNEFILQRLNALQYQPVA
jgi:hypothetical protein